METLVNARAAAKLSTLLLYFCFSSAAVAQDDHKEAQQIIDAGNRSISQILGKFRANVAPEHKSLLTSDNVLVVAGADLNAFVDPRERKIYIPAQVVVETLLQIHAFQVIRNIPSAAEKYEPWMRYLTERSDRAQRKFLAGSKFVDDEPIQPFWRYSGYVAQATDERDAVAAERLITEALALVVAHELGHLVFNHPIKTEPEESRRLEREADNFAVQLMRKSGIPVLPGLQLIYLRFAMLEEGVRQRHGVGQRTHERAMCRFYWMGKTELDEMLGDPSYAKHSMVPAQAMRRSITLLGNECRGTR